MCLCVLTPWFELQTLIWASSQRLSKGCTFVHSFTFLFLSLPPIFSLLSYQILHTITPSRVATPTLASAAFSFEMKIWMQCCIQESFPTNLMWQLKAQRYNWKLKDLTHLGRDDPKRCNQMKIMSFIQTSLAETESASPKSTTLYVYNMSFVLVACLLNRWERAAKCIWDRGESALDTVPALLTDFLLHQYCCRTTYSIQSNCHRDWRESALANNPRRDVCQYIEPLVCRRPCLPTFSGVSQKTILRLII